ncbi:MAG: hypothetical protein QOF89_1672 [Acidobacteriota bacterium]|nr:hypothetical protein [Acidobacteriota bacterium]
MLAMTDEDVCTLTLLGGFFLTRPDPSCELRSELVHFLANSWDLTSSQLQWCAELLAIPITLREAKILLERARASIVLSDLQLLQQGLGWLRLCEDEELPNAAPFISMWSRRGLTWREEEPALRRAVGEAFATLGTRLSFNKARIRRAFRGRMDLLHPDHLESLEISPAQRATAYTLVKEATAAWKVIQRFWQRLRAAAPAPVRIDSEAR